MWLKHLSDSVGTGIGAAVTRIASGYLCHYGWELPFYIVGECHVQCHCTLMLVTYAIHWA